MGQRWRWQRAMEGGATQVGHETIYPERIMLSSHVGARSEARTSLGMPGIPIAFASPKETYMLYISFRKFSKDVQFFRVEIMVVDIILCLRQSSSHQYPIIILHQRQHHPAQQSKATPSRVWGIHTTRANSRVTRSHIQNAPIL